MLSAVAAGGGGAIPAAAGGASAGLLGKFAFGGLASIAPMITMGGLMGGIALAGRGGPVTGAIGGAIAGLFGAGIGAFLYPALAAIPGIGWIAAGVGALIGGLIGLFGRGKQRKKATALEQSYEYASNEVLRQYLQHELDYESAIEQMQQMIQTGQQALLNSGTGKYGRAGAAHMADVIQANINYAQQIEKERQSRSMAMGAMTVPEFAVGGWTGRLPPGGTLAVLHGNEVVESSPAVNYWGKDLLLAMNRAPRFAEGGAVLGHGPRTTDRGQKIEVHFHVQAIDGQNVEQFFRRSQGYIVSTIRRAVMAGAF